MIYRRSGGEAAGGQNIRRIPSVEAYPAIFPGVGTAGRICRNNAGDDQKSISGSKPPALFFTLKGTRSRKHIMQQIMGPYPGTAGMGRRRLFVPAEIEPDRRFHDRQVMDIRHKVPS